MRPQFWRRGRTFRRRLFKAVFQKWAGMDRSPDRGYANLPAMARGALLDAFTRKPIAIRAKMFVIARAWRSYLGCPGIAQFPDVLRVTGYDNKK